MSSIPAAETEELKRRIWALVEPIVEERGAILVDIELSGGPSQMILRLLVHREPGISLDQCEAISREVADHLDIEDPIPGRYRLEVTSPGLDRPLRTEGDFARAMGRLLKVVMSTGHNHWGRLLGWDEDFLRLEREDGEIAVERAAIAKATIEVEFRKGRA